FALMCQLYCRCSFHTEDYCTAGSPSNNSQLVFADTELSELYLNYSTYIEDFVNRNIKQYYAPYMERVTVLSYINHIVLYSNIPKRE
ncbi:hypothetical protein HispidOSU_007184, partial [Sigmodon hispidus]